MDEAWKEGLKTGVEELVVAGLGVAIGGPQVAMRGIIGVSGKKIAEATLKLTELVVAAAQESQARALNEMYKRALKKTKEGKPGGQAIEEAQQEMKMEGWSIYP